VAVTLLAVGLVGEVLYERQKRETEATLGALLLNIARTGAYLIDPAQHLTVQRTLTQDTSAYLQVRHALSIVQDENRIATPVYTLTDYDAEKRQARFMVTSRGPGAPGEPYPLVPALLEPLGRAFRENLPRIRRSTRIRAGHGSRRSRPSGTGRGRRSRCSTSTIL